MAVAGSRARIVTAIPAGKHPAMAQIALGAGRVDQAEKPPRRQAVIQCGKAAAVGHRARLCP